MSDNQVALVTGATGTIGRAVATELGARGAALVLTGRREAVLDEVADELRGRGVRVATAVGDVADPAHAEQAVALASAAFGPVTTLVNNAGGGGGTSVADSDPAAWRESLLTNTFGPYLFARAVLPSMVRERCGRIITVASRAGTAAIPTASAYVVAKTAVMRLSETIAAETRGTGVVAFSLHPGGIVSGINAAQIKSGLMSADRFPDSAEAAARMIADLADGHYDVLSGAYLDVGDDLGALVEQRTGESAPFRALTVADLPDEFQGRPIYNS
ncbi:MAG TPA: SDR family oxidoreductase [Pseudonocardiaceae bacterium]|jgi:short-subunit dehydrogenase|nr:SDR family oxidoreductase [Pseudonocardiaceae bacterium]